MRRARRAKSIESQIAFDAISIEGGVLSPEWLARVANLTAGKQTEADYRVPKGLSLRDEIGRYWRIAQACWRDFAAGRVPAADARALTHKFVTGLLRDAFGFASLATVPALEVGPRSFPIGHAAFGNRVPVVLAEAPLPPFVTTIDAPDEAFADETRRRSAFGLAQEYLNAADHALWGIATDGCTLRILRDNASLTRPAWIEADLQRIFTEEQYADFAALWLLLHESRFGQPDHPVHDCALEVWRNAGREEGVKARETLRFGVEDALLSLGQGFLAHPANQELRASLESGALPARDFFNQLLRLIYRVIFLLTVEERGLLHPDGVPDGTKALYADGYGLRRLRERAVKRSAHDRQSDLWEGLKIVFRGVATGEARLGLPALAGIFASTQCPALDGARLENRALLGAVFRLAWLRDDGALARVNWRDMGPEELGSVYESLLELVPQITKDGRQFAFATGGETKGNARKTSGSYYTPDSLVQVLLDSALEPVIADTISKNPGSEVEALLKVSIVDPACGSGHFLLSAARRLAAHVARLHANGTPSAAEYRHALRQVVGRCIYGVDLNPMAVELCKVSLWMEAVEPGLPLTFLNSHIQHGNALLGTTPELMAKGIPDAAWEPIEGDDKKTASALKKRNKAGASGQRGMDALWVKPADPGADAVAQAVTALEAASDSDAQSLAQKELRWDGILGSEEYRKLRLVADAWCAAFVWPKEPGALADAAPTNELWRALRDGQGQPPALTTKTTDELAERYDFFHWHLQFPQVFAKGGFDVVLGNPPWERVKLQEQEFFSTRDDGIATAANAAIRKKLIAKLPTENPALWRDWCAAGRKSDGESQFIRRSGRFPLCGKGDVNTYAIFAEHNRRVRSACGRAGFIVPAGLVTDDTTKEFFGDLVDRTDLASVFHFENEDKVFPNVHNAFRFILLTIGDAQRADLAFFVRSTAALSDGHRHFSLTPSEFKLLNPNTRTCPTFRSKRDAEINLNIYRSTQILLRDNALDGNPWGFEVRTRLWHMAEDADWFRTKAHLEGEGWSSQGPAFTRGAARYLPLYEAKMIWNFDHRFATYDGATQANLNKGTLPQVADEKHRDSRFTSTPEYWVPQAEVEARLAGVWSRGWLLGWRDVTGSTVLRTVVAAVTPRTAVGNKLPLLLPQRGGPECAALYANLCSFVLDYAARQKVGGLSLSVFVLKQLPVVPPSRLKTVTSWGSGSLVQWLVPRVLELTYTAWDLESFANDVGLDGPPFRWDPERRFHLRCELDAAFFHLYGLSRDDTDYVMETFPIVKRKDEAAHGEYRTKRVILEIYDAMAEAARTGTPYQTRLDPPPADPRVAHPESTRPAWAKRET